MKHHTCSVVHKQMHSGLHGNFLLFQEVVHPQTPGYPLTAS